jgi:hypothetical protein
MRPPTSVKNFLLPHFKKKEKKIYHREEGEEGLKKEILK